MASTELSINTSLTQTIQTCVSVDVINDDILEGDENIFVYLEFAPENVFIVEGAEKLSVVIEDDEGITKQHIACMFCIQASYATYTQ